MPNTSATGGYLLPSSPPGSPPEDYSFEDLIQGVVVGLTGLPGNMVRPRWQAVTPKQPEPTVDWCAVGIMGAEDQAVRSQIQHFSAGDGYDIATRWELVDILVSAYGPNAWLTCSLIDSGLRIEQNRIALFQAQVGLRNIGRRLTMTELINERFVRRVDFPFTVVRTIKQTYPVLNLLRASGTVTAAPVGSGESRHDAFDTDNIA